MDLGFTDEQETLRESAQAFLESEASDELARSLDGAAIDRLWQSMVGLGWPSVTIPPSHGGAGMTFVELTIILERLGHTVAPSPFFATAGLFLPVVLAAVEGPLRSELLGNVVSGTTGTLAVGEKGGPWNWERTSTHARPDGTSWILDGEKAYVIEGAFAERLVLSARTDHGLALFVARREEVAPREFEAFDPSLRPAHIRLEGVRLGSDRLLAPPGHAEEILARALPECAVAAAALIVGTCDDIFARTLEYTKTREQFDQPIGRFQAVKHKLTDMYVAVERARSLLFLAALTIAEEDPRRQTATSMAKAAAGECQRLVGEDGLQLHGGIGYTWEYDLHLYLKRARSLEALLGDSRLHRKRIARDLGLA